MTQVGPKCYHGGLRERRRGRFRGTQTRRRVTTGRDWGVRPHTQDHLGPTEAGRAGGPSPRASERAQPADTLTSGFWPPEPGENRSLPSGAAPIATCHSSQDTATGLSRASQRPAWLYQLKPGAFSPQVSDY